MPKPNAGSAIYRSCPTTTSERQQAIDRQRVTHRPRTPIASLTTAPLALLLFVATSAPPTTARAADCSVTSTGLVPLSQLGEDGHKGQPGGLYPDGANEPPAAHLAAALAAAARVVPRGPAGSPEPEPAGRVVLLSVGMSNTTQEYSEFVRQAGGDRRLSPSLTLVDGAQGGQTAAEIRDPAARFWSVVDQRLTAAGVTPAQVQVIWLKEANRQPGADRNPDTLPAARGLADDLAAIVAVARDRFPNLALVYMSSRIYAGYASSLLNPEPYAYESALAVRWTIERQIEGDAGLDPAAGAPLLLWGPYLWADGLTPRADGLTWECADLREDGTHPSESGRAKVAGLLMAFFESEATSRGWFLAEPGGPPVTATADATIAPTAPTPPPTPTVEATTEPTPRPGATATSEPVPPTPTVTPLAAVERAWLPWLSR